MLENFHTAIESVPSLASSLSLGTEYEARTSACARAQSNAHHHRRSHSLRTAIGMNANRFDVPGDSGAHAPAALSLSAGSLSRSRKNVADLPIARGESVTRDLAERPLSTKFDELAPADALPRIDESRETSAAILSRDTLTQSTGNRDSEP